MTKEQKDKIIKALVEDRNNYARDCNRRIAEENGKITGADYMLQRFLDVFRSESESQYSIKMVTNAKDAENYPISEDMSKGIEEINKLIFENGQAESEDKE